MNSFLQFNTAACCVGCLSPERTLNYINDAESKVIFGSLLDNLVLLNPLLCYECTARLNNFVRFKRQVNNADKFLKEYSENNLLPILSRLSITRTDTINLIANPITQLKNDEGKRIESLNLDSDHDFEDPSSPYNIQDSNKYISQESHKNDKLITSQNSSMKIETSQENCDILTNDIKLEQIEEISSKEYNIEIKLKEEKREYQFNESDDEPLTQKQSKKKVKKGAKVQNRGRTPGVVNNVWVEKKLKQLNVPPGVLEMVVLSWDEVESERQKSLSDIKYTRHEYRCTWCVVGFNHRFKLDTHMKKHSSEAGELECNVCKTRFKTLNALISHRSRHQTRWRCSRCSRMFSRASIAADHHSATHAAARPTHACHVCGAVETSLTKLRIHLKQHAERQHCDQCGKTFRDKSSLRTHLYIHTNQKDFVCEVCDKRFRFKKALESHRLAHQASELLYCSKCDMNFKNKLSFYQHVNYSMAHIHPDKLKYACEFCSRRFSKPMRLEEHRLSIHLKLTPHRCTAEGCSFASASRPALRTHVRMVHRNKRLERNHVCHTCGKAYTTKKILEGHIRSHTGERPYICSKCPATFSHDAALYNHNKLVHKKPFVRRGKQTLPEVPANWPVPEACQENMAARQPSPNTINIEQ